MLSIHSKVALFFFISLFGLSTILKIRNGEHVHYVGLVVAYTWNREKQTFVALGKEFDMQHVSTFCSFVFHKITESTLSCHVLDFIQLLLPTYVTSVMHFFVFRYEMNGTKNLDR